MIAKCSTQCGCSVPPPDGPLGNPLRSRPAPNLLQSPEGKRKGWPETKRVPSAHRGRGAGTPRYAGGELRRFYSRALIHHKNGFPPTSLFRFCLNSMLNSSHMNLTAPPVATPHKPVTPRGSHVVSLRENLHAIDKLCHSSYPSVKNDGHRPALTVMQVMLSFQPWDHL